MVEINNQRKAFLDMLAWSEGTDNGRQKTRNHGWRHCRPSYLLITPITLINLYAKPKTQINGAGRYSFFPVGGMPTASETWPAKDFSPKSQDAVALQRIKERGAYVYDWSCVDIVRQSTVAAISGLALPGAGYGQFEHKADSLIAKIQSGRNGQRDWCMSRVTAIISALVICIIVCLSWAVKYLAITLTYKAQRDKNAEAEAGERGNYWRTLRQRDVAALDAKYTKLADAKAENDALRDDVAAGRRRLHIKAVCQSVREATTASGVDMQPPPDWQTPLNGIISPSRGWSLCKNNWKEPRSILMSSADRVAHIDGQLMQLLWAIHTRFQRSINA